MGLKRVLRNENDIILTAQENLSNLDYTIWMRTMQIVRNENNNKNERILALERILCRISKIMRLISEIMRLVSQI